MKTYKNKSSETIYFSQGALEFIIEPNGTAKLPADSSYVIGLVAQGYLEEVKESKVNSKPE